MQSIRQAAGIKLPEPDMPNIKVEKEGLIAKLKSFFKSMLSDSHDGDCIEEEYEAVVVSMPHYGDSKADRFWQRTGQ